jgi:hypothetical protein
VEIPKRQDLLDPSRRDKVLADAGCALLVGEIDDKTASALKTICKELRDNADLQKINRDVDYAVLLMDRVFKRKGRQLSGEEIHRIIDRVLAGEPDDGR